jgi:hypothetical protein
MWGLREGYQTSKLMVLDETNLKIFEREEQSLEVKRLKKAILEGEWPEVDRLVTLCRPLLKNHKSFLYAAYRQQYLEYIEHQEIQKVCWQDVTVGHVACYTYELNHRFQHHDRTYLRPSRT